MKLLLVLMLFCNISFGETITKNIHVSASVIYNCSIKDERVKKYCEEKQEPKIEIKDNYIIKEY